MAGLMRRISTLIRAKINKLLNRAEDPAETLDYAYERQLKDLQNVKKGIADVVTAKKRLQMQEAQLGQQAGKLDSQAREAMSAGREDLARTALERKRLIVQETGSLDQQVSELESEQQKLTESEQQLRTKIEAFRSKKEVIKAQYSAADAQVRISEAATGIGDDMADVGMAMQRAMDKTETMKARVSAVEELQAAGTFEDLTALGPAQDDIDCQLEQLGAKSAVDDELGKLKAEHGATEQPPEIGAGEQLPRALRRLPMGASDSSGAPATTRVTAIVEFLDGAGVEYELIEHEPTMSGAAEARVTEHAPDQVAKTVVLRDGGAYVIAVIPASQRLDVHKLRELLGAPRQLRLASEDQIARDFPTLKVGAVPPFGPMVPAAEVIDRALLEQQRILCPGGDHRPSVLIDPRDVVRITAATLADICQE